MNRPGIVSKPAPARDKLAIGIELLHPRVAGVEHVERSIRSKCDSTVTVAVGAPEAELTFTHCPARPRVSRNVPSASKIWNRPLPLSTTQRPSLRDRVRRYPGLVESACAPPCAVQTNSAGFAADVGVASGVATGDAAG